MTSDDFLPGSLVRPREDRCVINQRTNKIRNGRYVYKKIYMQAIKVCKEANRERPSRSSRWLFLGETAIVLEHLDGRYPMVKLLTSAEGSQWVGWCLLEDIELVNETQEEQTEVNNDI